MSEEVSLNWDASDHDGNVEGKRLSEERKAKADAKARLIYAQFKEFQRVLKWELQEIVKADPESNQAAQHLKAAHAAYRKQLTYQIGDDPDLQGFLKGTLLLLDEIEARVARREFTSADRPPELQKVRGKPGRWRKSYG